LRPFRRWPADRDGSGTPRLSYQARRITRNDSPYYRKIFKRVLHGLSRHPVACGEEWSWRASRLDNLRPVIVAVLLELSEPTVRAWLKDGVFLEASLEGDETSATIRLDPIRVHQVLHLVKDLRAQGKKRHLVELIWAKLQDEALLEREDLRQSLEQFRSGDTVVLRPRK
ncbi:hypothetical protein, partial [Kibdelosporangium philippinense]